MIKPRVVPILKANSQIETVMFETLASIPHDINIISIALIWGGPPKYMFPDNLWKLVPFGNGASDFATAVDIFIIY